MSRQTNRMITAAGSFLLALTLSACGPEGDGLDGSDPEEFAAHDPDGSAPVDEDALTDGELGTLESGLSRPVMRMPFPCGQTWSSQTRANHSPAQAVDFNRLNDQGDTVVASAPGTVTRSESEGNVSYGNWVEIAHANGYRTRYAHLSVRSVRVGQVVGRGQRIGLVGSTGGSTGPHLHYEQRLWGSPIRVRLGATDVRYYETRSYRSRNGC